MLIALPLTGLAAWFLQVELAGEAHDLGQALLLWMLGLHVLGVAVHQFWWRTGLLRRMI
ncbi:cytochrome b/b6 domain-containing protein [Sulfitobacter sp. M22]|jgi:cytochrome b561|uniref:cytochrome b/b6 domain-containing protein n=1 Tax=Sulfitobacter sp. M22 TaxID=2675332 RepID=UPI001F2EDDE5|nr:cytochrome b/b6 domain-containing protein [Sulfitobacter sp. M22]MCF7728407.1 hypothetical protein [Sulfitobacter sp. M22]|tara:strand:- start:417 stop:593 length:177 start_codon:yes stop_codon:yes gene_type:complete